MKYKLINRTKIPREDLETAIEFSFPKGITKKVTISVMYDKKDSVWSAVAFGFRKNKSIQMKINKRTWKYSQVFPVFSSSKIERKGWL